MNANHKTRFGVLLFLQSVFRCFSVLFQCFFQCFLGGFSSAPPVRFPVPVPVRFPVRFQCVSSVFSSAFSSVSSFSRFFPVFFSVFYLFGFSSGPFFSFLFPSSAWILLALHACAQLTSHLGERERAFLSGLPAVSALLLCCSGFISVICIYFSSISPAGCIPERTSLRQSLPTVKLALASWE